VHFQTIYPGWYAGRTVHQHFKVRTDPAAATGYQFTSQLYFDDAVTDAVMTQAPYNTKTGARVLNAQDGIFVVGGQYLMLSLTQNDAGTFGSFDIGLDIP
jgi:protocatechuate 3,4-dioxygenase beta subunit